MMIAITVAVDSDLRKVLRSWDREILTDLKKAHKHIANWVVWRARRFAPKDSYALASSLVGKGQQDGAYIMSRLVYAKTQHWGSRERNIKSRGGDPRGTRFVYNTIIANRETIVKMYQTFIDNFWRKVNARLG